MKVSQVIKIYKNTGETPLEAINRLKSENRAFEGQKMTYAGRLDPLAEGEMIVLIGDACKDKDKYLNLDKIYTVDVLFGVGTDTHDVLGLIDDYDDKGFYNVDILKEFIGKMKQVYPMYSSKTFRGKSLFTYARNNIKIEDEDMPVKDIEIYSIDIVKKYFIDKDDLKKNILNKISLVKGDFRQDEIIKKWDEFFIKTKRDQFDILKIKVFCSSGTYMRSLAHIIGLRNNTKAIALNIKREKIVI